LLAAAPIGTSEMARRELAFLMRETRDPVCRMNG